MWPLCPRALLNVATVSRMDAGNEHPDDAWPLPPSWMWGCGECIELYKAMKLAPEVVEAALEEFGPGVDCDPSDSVVTTQIRLARHIAVEHEEFLPDADESCEKCMSDLRRRLPELLVLEHRARHVFAPPRIVGLL